MTAKTRIIRVGNTQAIRVPKGLLEQAQLPEELEIHAEPGRLVVSAARQRRAGWAEAARTMHDRGEDRLLDEPAGTKFEQEDWRW